MPVVIFGCGHNGFSQLEGFKCLNFNEGCLVVSNVDHTSTRTDQRNKVLLPEILLQLNEEYNLHNVLFTWSQVAVTLRKDLSYMSIITGFTNTRKEKKDDFYASTLVLDDHVITASTDTDFLVAEGKGPTPNIILQESSEIQPVHINLSGKSGQLQTVVGGHQDFFAVYDSQTFVKLYAADTSANNDSMREDGNKKIVEIDLHPIDSGIQIKEISCGKEHTLILSRHGAVYTYGLGSRGQLGHSSVEAESSPRLLAALEGVQMSSVCAGGWHSASISGIGDLYMWGWNESGQLGISAMTVGKKKSQLAAGEECVGIQAEPWFVTMPEELNISSVACGSRHTVFLTDSGRVFTSGRNACGQLGLGNMESRDEFTEVVAFKGQCSRIFAGQWNSFFVCDSNKL